MKKPSVILRGRVLCSSFILSLFLFSCGAENSQQPKNQAPTISQVVVPTMISVGQRAVLRVEVSDLEGDALTYEWKVSGGLLSENGAEALWLAPTEPGKYTLSVTVKDSKGGSAQKSVELVVLGSDDFPQKPPEGVNLAAPIIQSLWAAPSVLTVEKTAEVTVEATDPASGEMRYFWRATGGQLLPAPPNVDEGEKMLFVPPEQPGTYTLTVVVINRLNEKSEASTQVRVLPEVAGNRPPSIKSLQVQPKQFVRGGRDTATFTVSAIDPDGDVLTYIWNQPRGTMKGEGTKVQWTAPPPIAPCCAIPYTVTVAITISDGRGGNDTASITMTVVP